MGDLDLVFFDSGAREVRKSDSVSSIESVSGANLAAGTYLVRVYGYGGARGPSNMTVSIMPPSAVGSGGAKRRAATRAPHVDQRRRRVVV